MDKVARRRIEIEGMRLLFEQNGTPEQDIFRPLHLLAVAGAAAVGLVVWSNADLPLYRIALWCTVVFIGETLITILNVQYAHHRPSDEDLRRWAYLKTAGSVFNAASWSMGVMLLHVEGSLISVLAPVWGIINFMAATIWVAAMFAPAMVLMMLAAALPAAAYLLTFVHTIEFDVGMCLVVSLPYLTWLGLLSLKKTREAISQRLEIADLLAMTASQAEKIRNLFTDRTRFFSAASHDLRQPLSAMSYYCVLLEMAATQDDRDDIVMRLQDCAGSLQRQFDAIMGVAEADTATIRVSESDSALQTVFDRLAVTLRPQAEMKSLRFRIVPTRLTVRADPDVLFRALVNIAANAVKYTPAGTVLIGVRPRGAMIAVHVVDSGIGIEQSHLTDIFDDHFQLGNPERDSRKGLGIGLGVVRRICDAMGWQIDVTSQPGHGTKVSLLLPRGDVSMVNESSASNRAPVFGEADSAPVLIIDDDPLLRDSIGRLLTSWGHACTTCSTGAEALAAVKDAKVETDWRALIDWRLAGGENGIDVARHLRALFGDRVEITLMTGDIDPSINEEAKKHQIPLLRKPIQPIRLRAVLARPQSRFEVR